MDKELKVGIVGFGGAGLAQYDHFRSIEKCNVVAVYDPNQAGLDRAGRLSPDLFLTDDFGKFLEADIDVVAICSPDKTHADYMAQSIRAGKHTICEKPLTDSLDGCKKILEAERTSPGVVAAVQHQMRFLPLYVRIKEAIQSGALGKISYIEGYYVHNLTKRGSLYDMWRFQDNATPLVYSGCHFVDLLRWLLDDEVVEVMGMANNIAFPDYPESDLNVILLRFRSGIIGKVITAFGAGRPQDHSVRVYGSEKSVENNLLFDKDGRFSVLARPFFLYDGRSGSPTFRNKVGSIRTNYKAAMVGMLFEILMRFWNRKRRGYPICAYPMRLYEHSFAVHASIVDFVRAIRTGQRPRGTVAEAAKTVVTCLAGVEAYRSGQTVQLAKYWIPEFDHERDERR
jgi:UDP-N-acetylglucosamine 3-dehydrogenase